VYSFEANCAAPMRPHHRILIEEFLDPLALSQGDLAEAMGVPRKHVNELCNDRRAVTTDTALMLAPVFGGDCRRLRRTSIGRRDSCLVSII
jgi:addiction module HigA family antidote